MQGNCSCFPLANTDGCTEWSCLYHGRENQRRQQAQRDACKVHGLEGLNDDHGGTEAREQGDAPQA